MDFTPAEITVIFVRERPIRSADSSYAASRCTPPSPPVANTRIPARAATKAVAATVVPPARPNASAGPRSRLLTLITDSSAAIRASAASSRPTCGTPSITAIVAGVAPASRAVCSKTRATSALRGRGKPCEMIVDSSATTGRRSASAVATSSDICTDTPTVNQKPVDSVGRVVAIRRNLSAMTNPAGAQRKLSQLDSDVHEIYEMLKNVGATQKAHGRQLTSLDSKVTGLGSQVGGLTGTVIGLDGKVTGLDAKVTGLDGKVTGLDAKVTGLDGKVTGLDGKVTGLDAKVTGLDAKVTGLDGKVDKVSDRLDGFQQELRHIGGAQLQQSSRLNQMDRNLMAVNERLDGVDDRFDGVEDRLTIVEEKLDRQDTKLDEHSATLDAHGGKLDAHGATLDQHTTTLAEHGGKLDQIIELLTPGRAESP